MGNNVEGDVPELCQSKHVNAIVLGDVESLAHGDTGDCIRIVRSGIPMGHVLPIIVVGEKINMRNRKKKT